MRMLQLLRERAFWFLDVLRGGTMRKHYRDVKDIIEYSEFRHEKRENYLKELLEHATKTTNFYSVYHGFSSISDFPVINKNLVRDNFEKFRSSSFQAKDCQVVSTSGSTGAPFSVLHNPDKSRRSKADNIYFSERAGYKIGQKLIYIKIWPDHKKNTPFSQLWFKNIHPQSVFHQKDKDIKALIRRLKNCSKKKSFLGYPSAFERICRYLDEIKSDHIPCNTISVIAMSESMNTYTREKMAYYFGATPVSRYSNNEHGIIAQEDSSGSAKYVINEASYFLEVFDMNRDIPVLNGELGRIVVTDLHNYAMPLIRYDTGDVGTISRDARGIPYLESVEGRKMDLIYNTKGKVVPSHVSYKLCKYGNYKQFQLIQTGERDYSIRLNTDKKVDEFAVLNEFKEYFGADANIKIVYVDEIPLLSSGKRKEVLNTYHSQL